MHRLLQPGLKPGELDPDAAAAAPATPAARRQRELQGRRSYLRNAWYAAALSRSVKRGAPHGVEMCGKRFVLWRDEIDGTVRCLDDVCPHRWVGGRGGGGDRRPGGGDRRRAGGQRAAAGGCWLCGMSAYVRAIVGEMWMLYTAER